MMTLNAARGILSIPESRRDIAVSRPVMDPIVLSGISSAPAAAATR